MFRPTTRCCPTTSGCRSATTAAPRPSCRAAAGARPQGQRAPPTTRCRTFGPSERLDYELELGLLIGPGNELGEPIPHREAETASFGVVLLNDWSARDIQAWEYQPLGPFLAKNFCDHRVALGRDRRRAGAVPLRRRRAAGRRSAAAALPGLDAADRAHGAVDIALEVWLQTARMRDAGCRRSGCRTRNALDALLDAGAAGGPPHHQRLQPADRRPAGQRHHVGRGAEARAARCSR